MENDGGSTVSQTDDGVVGTDLVTWGYRPGLDGLRSIAVYLVVAFHAGIHDFSGGFIGVDLFFVLSGYVVTNVIISEVDAGGTINLRRFYARRFRRLAPAAGALVALTSVTYLFVKPVVERLSALNDAQAALLYVSNWHSIREAADYFAEGDAPSPFVHFWSLAIEEQFYFAFPLLIFVVLRYTKMGLRSRQFLVLIGALIATSVALQLVFASGNVSRAYYGTDSRLYQILGGCALALVMRRWSFVPMLRQSWLAASIGLGGLLLASSNLLDVSPSVRGLMAAALALALVAGLELAPADGPSRLLAWSPLVYLGSISYSTYLWHWPVMLVMRQFVDVRPGVLFVGAGLTATALAALSTKMLEMPIRESTFLRHHNSTTIATSLAITVALAFIFVPPVLSNESPPQTVMADSVSQLPPELAVYADMPIPRDIPFKEISKESVRVPRCNPKNWQRCTVVKGDGKNVLLIGDSIALQFVPAFEEMAKQNDWTLTVNTVSGCSWQLGLKPRSDLNEGAQARCANQRDDWYRTAIPELDPDVIVLAQLARDEDRFADQVRPSDPSRDDWTLRQLNEVTIQETFEFFRSRGYPVVVIESPPFSPPGRPDPLECLSSARTVGQCIFRPTVGLPSTTYIRDLAAKDPGIETVSLDDLVCPELPECVPVQRGVISWRNSGHLSRTYIELITPDIESLLLPLDAFSS